jgi:hypothetical protein
MSNKYRKFLPKRILGKTAQMISNVAEEIETIRPSFISPRTFVNIVPLTAIGVLTPYVMYETYNWYKNRMNSGVNKKSTDYSTLNNISGANVEDKLMINKLITVPKVDVETINKITRLAGMYY